MARDTTDMVLKFYGVACIPVQCKISSIGTTVATKKNAVLLFWGGSASIADDSIIVYQIQ